MKKIINKLNFKGRDLFEQKFLINIIVSAVLILANFMLLFIPGFVIKNEEGLSKSFSLFQEIRLDIFTEEWNPYLVASGFCLILSILGLMVILVKNLIKLTNFDKYVEIEKELIINKKKIEKNTLGANVAVLFILLLELAYMFFLSTIYAESPDNFFYQNVHYVGRTMTYFDFVNSINIWMYLTITLYIIGYISFFYSIKINKALLSKIYVNEYYDGIKTNDDLGKDNNDM